MYSDITDLREFYQSPRGQVAARVIGRALSPQLQKKDMAAVFGYAPSFLLPAHFIALMPAGQGVCHWPSPADNRAALVDETAWPLADQSLDTLVLMHALEGSGEPLRVLHEAWRVLKANGRLYVIVPNRHGLWARAESTPFGQGHPYTATQLRKILHQTQFMAESWSRLLFVPPFKSRTALRGAALCESVGKTCLPTFGGVILLSASKQLFAPTGRIAMTQRPPVTNLLSQPTA